MIDNQEFLITVGGIRWTRMGWGRGGVGQSQTSEVAVIGLAAETFLSLWKVQFHMFGMIFTRGVDEFFQYTPQTGE
jgi:hypothetical protein